MTGEVPFPGANHLEVVEKKSSGDFQPASALNPDVPPFLDEIIDKMLQRDPRDRYQTASELIIDLERSRLASPVLSFADLDLAMQDPAAQAYLASSAEPTRLEAGLAAAADEAAANVVWYIRYRVKGSWRKRRGTTREIVRRLKAGTLPAHAEACRPDGGDFRPLRDLPEFRPHVPRRRPRPTRLDRAPANGAPIAPAPGRRRRGFLIAVGATLAAVALLAGLLVILFHGV